MHSIFLNLLSTVKKVFILSWQFFTGVVVAVVAFSTNFYDLKQPDLSVEITEVTSTDSVPLNPAEIPELSGLNKALGLENAFLGNMNKGMPPEEIERQIQIVSTRILTRASTMDNYEKVLTQLTDTEANYSQEQLEKLISFTKDLNPFYFMSKSLEPEQEQPLEDKIKNATKTAKKNLFEKQQELENDVIELKSAKDAWNNYKKEVLPGKTRLVVTCAIGNRGAGSTSLKPQALFRANLGSGNYLDFPMKLRDYDSAIDRASLQSQVFKVLRFESDELQSMVQADRDRFKSFLGNASPATLFISDVRGKTYSSNTVPFSPGVYEQKIYDSLKQFASK